MIARYLFPTERFRGQWRRHWLRLAWRIVAGVIVAAVFFLGETGRLVIFDRDYSFNVIDRDFTDIQLLAGLAVLVALWTGWSVLAWRRGMVALTDCRLLLVTGVLNRRVSALAITSLDSLGVRQSLLGRIFGYASLTTPSVRFTHPLARIRHLGETSELYLRVVEECFEPEAASARTPQLALPATAAPYPPVGRSPAYAGAGDEYPDTGGAAEVTLDQPTYRVPRHRAKPTKAGSGSVANDN
jgi:hypothetical protein